MIPRLLWECLVYTKHHSKGKCWKWKFQSSTTGSRGVICLEKRKKTARIAWAIVFVASQEVITSYKLYYLRAKQIHHISPSLFFPPQYKCSVSSMWKCTLYATQKCSSIWRSDGETCDPIYVKAIAQSIKMDHHQPIAVCTDCQRNALEKEGTRCFPSSCCHV